MVSALLEAMNGAGSLELFRSYDNNERKHVEVYEQLHHLATDSAKMVDFPRVNLSGPNTCRVLSESFASHYAATAATAVLRMHRFILAV